MRLNPADVQANVSAALAEDVGTGDVHTDLFVDKTPRVGFLDSRSRGILCGRPWVEETCFQVDPQIHAEWYFEDGERIKEDECIAQFSGPPSSLLTAERTFLNFLQTLSGTATRVRNCVDLIADEKAVLLDTRKTIPGLRRAQKYAVVIGGGTNHRFGLFDEYLIKDNHILAAGGISEAVSRARKVRPNLPLVVEVETNEELEEALETDADRLLLDNYSTVELIDAVKRVNGRVPLEASGGITSANLSDVARTGVDFISMGNLTKSIEPLDFSFNLKRPDLAPHNRNHF